MTLVSRPAAGGSAPHSAAAPDIAEPDLLEEPTAHNLAALLRPRSIAVIGASREPGTIGHSLFANLMKGGFTGPVYPVHPTAPVVQSVRAYPSIADVPDPVELAVVVVPARFVVDVVDACGRKGVKAVVVISAGFKEVGGAGVDLERTLLDVVHRHDLRLVGPNCLGVLNTDPAVHMQATFAPVSPPAGNVAFSSQSGALGVAVLEYATSLGIGISQFVSVGNKADVSGNDLLLFWEDDPRTDVILLYLESFGNPRRFLEIARRVTRRKPIVAVKSGRTRAGMRAASSHTGALAGADTAVSALCTQAGVIRTDTIDELFDVTMILANQPVPRGHRVAILTNAGGPGILASDACETRGLEVPALTEATVAALHEFLAPEASTRNPVDMIASATPDMFERTLQLLANDPHVDAVLAIYVPPTALSADAIAQAIVRGNQKAKADAIARGEVPKPVLSCFMGTRGVVESLRSLSRGHIPSFNFPESAAIALSRVVKYGRWLSEPDSNAHVFDDVDRAGAEAVLARAGARATAGAHAWLVPDEVRAVLSAYRIGMPAAVLARSADEAVDAAQRAGHPVAVKLVSDTITHKSDVGGVVLDCRDDDDVRAAFAGIQERLAATGHAGEMAGVVVQPMITEGIEAIVGMTRDPSFGPLIMFGLGGVEVELLQDVVFRVHPLTERDASQMVRGLKGSKLFEGYRGAPPGDVAALEETLLRMAQLAGDHPGIVEMDLNPLKVREPGRGCLVLDARIAVSG
jgi:acetyl coenzyme A synthetase (ADP forming)-like protein